MANGSTRDVKLTLSVESLGQENVAKLEKALRELAATGDTSAAEFGALADQIARLGAQNDALQAFKELAAEATALAERQGAVAEKVNTTKATLDRLASATEAARQAQQQARAELLAGEQAYVAAGNALRELKAAYDTAGRQSAEYRSQLQRLVGEQNDARAALVGLREANRQASAALTEATREQRKAATAYDASATAMARVSQAAEKQDKALRQAAAAAATLGVDTNDLAGAEATLLATFSSAARAAESRKAALAEMAEADRLAAIEARTLEELYRRGQVALQAEAAAQRDAARAAQEYARAKAEAAAKAEAWQREADAIVDMAEAQRRSQGVTAETLRQLREVAAVEAFSKQAAEARRMLQAAEYVRFWERALDEADRKQRELAENTRQLNEAFKTLNIRPVEQVRQEIAQTNAAMKLLAQSGRLAGGELAVAMSQGKQRIAALELEIRKLTGSLTVADRAAALFRTSMGQIAAGNMVADAVGYLVNKVKELGREFVSTIAAQEKLGRGLNAVYKDAGLTASQMEFLRNTAVSAGVSVADLGPAFLKFSASTRAANIPLEVTNQLFAAVTRAAGTLGLSGEEVNGMLEALSQMAAKGVVSMEELRQQLGDRLPGALSLVAQGMGISEAQLIKLVESGQLAARDLFPALTKGLTTMQGEVSGLNVTWENFKNVLTGVAQDAGNAGWAAILTGVLKVLGGTVGAVALGFSTLWEALRLVGVGVLALGATLRGDGTQALAFFNEQVQVSVDRLANQADRLNAMLDPASESAKRLRDAADAATKHAAAAQKASTAAQALTVTLAEQEKVTATVAKSAEYAAKVNEIMGNGAMDLSAKIVKINTLAGERLPLLEKEAVAADKLAKATHVQGEAITTLAQIRGSETETIKAQISAAEANLASLQKAADAHRAVSETLQLQREAVYNLAQQEASGVAGRQQELLDLDKKITAQKAETEQSVAAVEQMKNEVVARQVAAQTLADNSQQLGQFRDAAVQAQAALAALRVEFDAGRATAEQVADAQRRAAVATALYRDALKDLAPHIQAKNQLEQANINIKTAGLSVEQQAYMQLAATARATGDLTMATHYEIRAKQMQIEITLLQAEAKKKEAEAAMAAAKAEMEALKQTGQLTETKRLEIEARIANARAKAIEAGASDTVIRALQEEIKAIREKNEAVSSGVASTREATAASNEHAVTLENEGRAARALAEHEENLRRGRTKDGFGTDAAGNKAVGGSDLGTLTGVANFLKGLGLDEQTARRVALEFSDGKGNIPFINNPGQLRYKADSLSMALVKAAEQFTFSDAGVNGSAAGFGGNRSTGNAPASGQSMTTSTTPVVINVGGKQTKVAVGSSADAEALTGVIRQLEQHWGVSS